MRRLLQPLAACAAAAVVLAVGGLLITHPALVPSYSVLVWSQRAGLVIAVDAAIGRILIALHELGHLVTARTAGAPARISLGTRLQFLVAQTDVSGVWATPRRIRMTVYLAGLTVDLCGALSCLLTVVLADPEFIVFMRTDLYFVLLDLTGCANPYADSAAYLRYRVSPRGGKRPDPSLGYPLRQRRAIRWFTVVLLAGTATCLGVEFAVSVPALIVLLAHAISETARGGLLVRLDGAVALAVLARTKGGPMDKVKIKIRKLDKLETTHTVPPA